MFMSSLERHSTNCVCLLFVRTLRPRVSPVPDGLDGTRSWPVAVRSWGTANVGIRFVELLGGRSGDLIWEVDWVLGVLEGGLVLYPEA
jgi:hypothetical protein